MYVRASLALVALSLALPCAAHADPRSHFQLTGSGGFDVGDVRTGGGASVDAPLTGIIDARLVSAQGHGLVARVSFHSGGLIFATEHLDAQRAELGYAFRAPLAGRGSEPWLVGNAFAAAGYMWGSTGQDTCGLCLFTTNEHQSWGLAGVSASAGASLDARLGGFLIGLAAEIHAMPVSNGRTAPMPLTFFVGPRIGVDLPL